MWLAFLAVGSIACGCGWELGRKVRLEGADLDSELPIVRCWPPWVFI